MQESLLKLKSNCYNFVKFKYRFVKFTWFKVRSAMVNNEKNNVDKKNVENNVFTIK